MGLSIWHLLVVLVIALIIFGTKKIRNLGGDLGGAIKNFKTAVREDEANTAANDDEDDDGKPRARLENKPARVIEGKSTAAKTGTAKAKSKKA